MIMNVNPDVALLLILTETDETPKNVVLFPIQKLNKN